MAPTDQAKRLADMAGAMRLARGLIGHDRWSDGDERLVRFRNPALAPADDVRAALRVLSLDLETAPDASKLYAMNCANFAALLLKEGETVLDFDDELVAGSAITRDGRIVNERVAAVLGVRA